MQDLGLVFIGIILVISGYVGIKNEEKKEGLKIIKEERVECW